MACCFLSRASSVVATPFCCSKIAVLGLPPHQDPLADLAGSMASRLPTRGSREPDLTNRDGNLFRLLADRSRMTREERLGPWRALVYVPTGRGDMSDAAFTALLISAVLFTVVVVASIPRLDD
jgi:hypothetical protein